MTATTTEPAYAPELVLVRPSTLLVDGNIRKVGTLDPALVESIREHGVRTPVSAVRNSDGGLLVRLGQRRTLAAVEAGDDPIPVYVEGPADSDETARITDQWVENEHRAPLVTDDRVGALAQLSLLGVSAEDIVKRTKASRTDVDRALAVAASKTARAATEQHTALTLEHAAAVAEFEDLPDVAQDLIDIAVEQPGRFAYEAQRARDNRARLEKIASETRRLEMASIQIIPEESAPPWGDSSNRVVRRLDNLTAPGGKALNGNTHKKCPGHRAIIDRSGAVSYACADWKGNGHVGKYDRPNTPTTAAAGDAEKAKAERRRVIENNKAWPTAETVRRKFVRALLKGKSLSSVTDGAKFLAAELVHGDVLRDDYGMRSDGKQLAADLLGHANVSELAAAVAKANEARAAVIALAVVLARLEANTDREHWRTVHATTRRYLDFLESNGYELSDVEKLAAGRKPGRRPTKATTK